MHPYQHTQKDHRPIHLYRVTCTGDRKTGMLKEAVVIAGTKERAKQTMHAGSGYTAEQIHGVTCESGMEGQVVMAIYYAEQKEEA